MRTTRIMLLSLTTLVMLAMALALPTAVSASVPPAWDPAGTTIAPGVTIGGVDVSNLTTAGAIAAVRAAYAVTPVRITLLKRQFQHTPAQLGQQLALTPAIADAYAVGRDGSGTPPPAATAIDLQISVSAKKVTTWVNLLKAQTLLPADNATWHIRRHRVVVVAERSGHALKTTPLKQLIVTSLTAPGAARRALGKHNELFSTLNAGIRRKQLGPVVIVDRSAHTATLWSPFRKLRTMPIAVGMTAHQTPLGSFTVVTKQKNSRWTPPNSEWAKNAQPIAPGPNNPLGTRWIGLSAGGIGMHGTNNEGSVGSAASHGCMRMHRRDVEWLFNKVRVGTPVIIQS